MIKIMMKIIMNKVLINLNFLNKKRAMKNTNNKLNLYRIKNRS